MSLPTQTPSANASLWVLLAGLSGALAVAAGAFGAHALRGVLPPRDLEIYQTAVQYQMLHTIALLGVAFGRTRWRGRLIDAAGYLFIAGILLFSGSLYALVLTNTRWLGAVTPFGGLSFIAGWLLLAWAGWRGEKAMGA